MEFVPFFRNDKIHTKRIAIFKNTMNHCKKDKKFVDSINHSFKNIKIWAGESETRKLHEIPDKFKGFPHVRVPKYTVSTKKTFLAAKDLAKNEGGKTAALNFASAINPGGGVKVGSAAQEENLCRTSTLYPLISHWSIEEQFYAPHRYGRDKDGKEVNYRHNDDIIYAPDVLVFRDDELSEDVDKIWPEEEWFNCDVITCAAPNLHTERDYRYPDMPSDEELYKIMVQRIKCILVSAILNEVDNIVLGAFGCGAFWCPPGIVAGAFHEVLVKEEYGKHFSNIEFAIYQKNAPESSQNYISFKNLEWK